MSASDAERALLQQVRWSSLPVPEAEYPFAAEQGRKWKFDLAWPEQLVAVEVDGGAFAGGRHTRGAGFRRDCEKLSVAAGLGWRVLRVMPEHIESGQALAWLEAAMRWGR